jgi:hypothetical protein
MHLPGAPTVDTPTAGDSSDRIATTKFATNLIGAEGPPATSVTGADAFGASPVVGVSVYYARQDHDHGLPAAPLSTYAGNPNTHVAATAIGQLLKDTSTPGLWQATAADNAHWIQIGGVLPTADPAIAGSLWANAGVVTVSAG